MELNSDLYLKVVIGINIGRNSDDLQHSSDLFSDIQSCYRTSLGGRILTHLPSVYLGRLRDRAPINAALYWRWQKQFGGKLYYEQMSFLREVDLRVCVCWVGFGEPRTGVCSIGMSRLLSSELSSSPLFALLFLPLMLCFLLELVTRFVREKWQSTKTHGEAAN